MIKKRYYTWTDFSKDLRILVDKINATQKVYKNIYAIPRGGLILGVALSHALGLPLLKETEKKFISKDSLIVDEIVDTGKAISEYRSFNTVCLHYKPSTAKSKPTFYCHRTSEWIVYPWEKKC